MDNVGDQVIERSGIVVQVGRIRLLLLTKHPFVVMFVTKCIILCSCYRLNCAAVTGFKESELQQLIKQMQNHIRDLYLLV